MKYFVKLAGKAFGPLEEDKIVEMYQAGRLKDPVEISRDKTSWISIDAILCKTPPALPTQQPVKPFAYSAPSNTDDIQAPNSPIWFYSVDGSTNYGPVSKSDLATLFQCGSINENSIAWQKGETARPISIIPELTDIFSSGNSQFSSAGFGGDNGSVPPIPPLPDNSSFNGSGSMYHSGASLGRSTNRSSANANLYEFFNNPDLENDNPDASNGYKHSPVGQTSRVSYLLLALFFGQLGIHNFYANRMDIAIIQLFLGLSNLAGIIVISFISYFTDGDGCILFWIPAITAFGLELWVIVEMCLVTHDGSGKTMY